MRLWQVPREATGQRLQLSLHPKQKGTQQLLLWPPKAKTMYFIKRESGTCIPGFHLLPGRWADLRAVRSLSPTTRSSPVSLQVHACESNVMDMELWDHTGGPECAVKS